MKWGALSSSSSSSSSPGRWLGFLGGVSFGVGISISKDDSATPRLG